MERHACLLPFAHILPLCLCPGRRPRHTLPLSGAEPVYDDRDARWFGDNDDVTHGSYSWAMQGRLTIEALTVDRRPLARVACGRGIGGAAEEDTK